MDVILGALVLAMLVALHLFMIVAVHRARSDRAESLEADSRTKAVWQSGG
jgi:hypothetical protein